MMKTRRFAAILTTVLCLSLVFATGASAQRSGSGGAASPASPPPPNTLTRSDAPQSFGAGGEAGLAEQEFRRGVQAYHRGTFNESIRLFERALSYLPNEPLILEWLGNAYYRSGMEGTALIQWEYAAENGGGSLMLKNKIDEVQNRRVQSSIRPDLGRYSESGLLSGKNARADLVFNQPVSILPNRDGTFWAAAYTSNELVRMDVNGQALDRVRGPLNGFDRPMDIARLKDGTLVVSEFFGDRLSFLSPGGQYVRSFASKGLGAGQVIGPQYLAVDSSDNIYVTDFGNARVVAFDREGNGILTFGEKNGDFPGFQAPTGIAVLNDLVYVADAVAGTVYRFDRFGNYLGIVLPEQTCVRPEALRPFGNYLLLTDSNRVLAVDTVQGTVVESARAGGLSSRLTSASADVNGNILTCNFQNNEIYVLSRVDDLVSGLFVQVERVVSDNFPTVTLEVSVETQGHQPVVGLKEVNFLITEESRIAAGQHLLGSASANDTCDIVLLLDRSVQTAALPEALDAAVREIAAAMTAAGATRTLRIISAGETPAPEYTGTPDAARNFSSVRLKTPVSQNCQVDLGVRLAANDLINGQQKRAIVYLTGGYLSPNAFARYGITDLAAYLNNNHIAFYSVNLTDGAVPEELAYLTSSTSGGEYFVYRPEGLGSIVGDVILRPVGLYTLSYTSSLPNDFGRAFLPAEVEIYHFNHSGRGESAYFAPLQ
ncbi:MAG: hypothetical protein LBS64_04670 [Spirochaetaceae bacterium]|jgi:DNA-binding beta-propeller fold protein YncE|nr:hypothetical protein [Spirochaetaceae bacterium]